MASFSEVLELSNGVNDLRNRFRQTFDCLEHLQYRLESQIEEGNYSSSMNPIKLSQRIKSLQNAIKNLQKRSDLIAEKKQEIVPTLMHQIAQNCVHIHELRWRSGLKAMGIPENVLTEFYDEIVKYNNKQCNDNEENQLQPTISIANMNSNENTESNFNATFAQSVGFDNSYGESSKNQTQSQSVDLLEQQFNDLPSLTKQRVTFDQMQDTYEVIKETYLSQPKKQRNPIAIKVLAHKGAHVTGQTGQAIVNCLRSLKLIQTSKKGIAVLD